MHFFSFGGYIVFFLFRQRFKPTTFQCCQQPQYGKCGRIRFPGKQNSSGFVAFQHRHIAAETAYPILFRVLQLYQLFLLYES